MIEVQIRPTIFSDLDALADILVAVHATDGYPVEGVDDPRAWVDPPNAVGQWTALLDGRPAGHVALLRPMEGDEAVNLLMDRESVPRGKVAVLSRLFVDPQVRGRGVGKELLKVAERCAKSCDLRLVLEVLTKDVAAIGLYARSGWATIGQCDHVWGKGFRAEALVMMKSAQPHRASDG